MKVERIQEIYLELEQMVVPLDQTPELGPEYFRERMQVCRRMQDWVAERTVEVNRDYSRVRNALRAAQMAAEIARDSAQTREIREQLRDLVGQAEDMKYLRDSLEIKRANLKQTGSDIRLIVGVVELGLKYGGEVQPGEDRSRGKAWAKPATKPKANRAAVVVEEPPPEPEPAAVPTEPVPVEIREIAPLVSAEVETDAFDIEAFLNN